eukprot:2477128-Prymnesium_polylepis.1
MPIDPAAATTTTTTTPTSASTFDESAPPAECGEAPSAAVGVAGQGSGQAGPAAGGGGGGGGCGGAAAVEAYATRDGSNQPKGPRGRPKALHPGPLCATRDRSNQGLGCPLGPRGAVCDRTRRPSVCLHPPSAPTVRRRARSNL